MFSYLTRWLLPPGSGNLVSLVHESLCPFLHCSLLFQFQLCQFSLLVFFQLYFSLNISSPDIVLLWFIGSEEQWGIRERCFRESGKIKAYCLLVFSKKLILVKIIVFLVIVTNLFSSILPKTNILWQGKNVWNWKLTKLHKTLSFICTFEIVLHAC